VPHTTMVCTDSLWEHTIALPNSTVDGTFRQKGKSSKNYIQNCCKIVTDNVRALYTRPLGTHRYLVWRHQCPSP